MPVNVLYLIDSLTHGGTERQLAELIRHLDQLRIRPHLCTLKPSGGLFDELAIPKICLNFSSFGSPSLFGVLKQLTSFISQNQITIMQTFFQDPCLLGAMVKPFTGIKLIGSFRDLGFWRTSSESRKMKLAYPLFNGFIANSQAVKDHFCSMDGIAPAKIQVIYNGFDLSSLPSTATLTSKLAAAPVVGIVANLNRPVKRVQDFIVAAARVHQQRPETRFMVVGGGHLQPELEQQAKSAGIDVYTRFTGMVSNPLEYIAQLTVGVITSETEGFCNSIIEYMACGLPVVASRVGGNIELVQEGENGFLYDMGNVEQLTAAIVQVLDNPAELPKVAAANRMLVRECYSVEAMVVQTCSYYAQILGRAS